MISNSLQTCNKINNSILITKTRKKRVGKVHLPAGSEEWLTARLFHPLKAVQKDLFRYLVCHRKEFCAWLKRDYSANLQKQHLETGADTFFRQERLFEDIAGFTICVFNPETGIVPAQPVQIISSHPFIALPPANARFKVIPVEVIFRSLQEILELAPTVQIATGQARRGVIGNIQNGKISLTQGARLLGVAGRTVSRLRTRGESSYNPVTDCEIFCELLGRCSKKKIATKYNITERTVLNIYNRVIRELLKILVWQ